MIDIVEKNSCCGCGACKEMCPRKAIDMQMDEKGFLYPIIDQEKCVDCGICRKACVINKSEEFKNDEGYALGAVNTNEIVRMKSTSGGAFSAISTTFIQNGGTVFGVASVDNYITHIQANTIAEIEPIRGSKYVQSRMDVVFLKISSLLTAGRKVMFSGTPCQCAAIKSYCLFRGLPVDNLFLIDVVCHGVCSPKVFADYIDYCSQRSRKNIVEHRFRDKVMGWSKHTEVNYYRNGEKDFSSYDSQLFKSIFHSHNAIRESCFNCKFTTKERVSDITMADFWGLKKRKPEYFDEKGVSFLLINSSKGEECIRQAYNQLMCFEADINDTDQPQLYRPCVRPNSVDRFWEMYKKGFGYTVVKMYHAGKIRRLLSKVYRYFCDF